MDKHLVKRDYPLPLANIAPILGMTQEKLLDLVDTGAIPALRYRREEVTTWWFNSGDIVEYKKVMADAESKPALTNLASEHVMAVLRGYLADRVPAGTIADADNRKAALLARTRQRRIHAHIQPKWVSQYARTEHPTLHAAATMLAVMEVMRQLGAEQVRGIRDLGGQQDWRGWYRIPRELWALHPEVEQGLMGWEPKPVDTPSQIG